jgi:hypothetical protein
MDERNPTNAGDNRIPGTFTKGDPRINRQGRPRAFDALREAAQEIAEELARDKQGKLIVDRNGQAMTNARLLLRKWLSSGEFEQEKHFMAVAYGLVPATIALTDKDGNAQPVTMIEVIKDRGDGSTETLRAITSAHAVSDSLHAHLGASIRADTDAHPPGAPSTTEDASMTVDTQDIAS